jgi:hypothetical protein
VHRTVFQGTKLFPVVCKFTYLWQRFSLTGTVSDKLRFELNTICILLSTFILFQVTEC